MTHLQIIGAIMLLLAASAGFTAMVGSIGLTEAIKIVLFSLSLTAFLCLAAYLLTVPA